MFPQGAFPGNNPQHIRKTGHLGGQKNGSIFTTCSVVCDQLNRKNSLYFTTCSRTPLDYCSAHLISLTDFTRRNPLFYLVVVIQERMSDYWHWGTFNPQVHLLTIPNRTKPPAVMRVD